jgi:hypothetical protein
MSQITVDLSHAELVGNNVKALEVGGRLVLVIDTRQEIGLSSSGKMMGIASTGGFTLLPQGLKGNIYIGKKR